MKLSNRSGSSRHRLFAIAAGGLLAFMAILAGGAARRESVTVDEVAHIGAGVSYLQKLDMRMNEEHPPLAKAVAALPLVLRGTRADYSHLSWTISSQMFAQYLAEWVFGHWFLMKWNDPYGTLFWARMAMLTMTLTLGLLLYIFGTRLGGPGGGLLSLSAFVTMPAFLAFGPLVITDMAIALFWVLTVWLLPKMWQSPTGGDVVKFGLALAGALLTKFSAGLLFFVFVTFALSLRLKPLAEQPPEKQQLRKWRRQGWRNVFLGTLWAAFFVYVAYLVLSWNQPSDSFDIIPHFSRSLVLRRLLMPPWIYLRGLIGFAFSAGSRPTFILGHAYAHGVWFYFPALFFLKSQTAFVLLLVLATAAALLMKKLAPHETVIPAGVEMRWRSLWVSLVVFVAACMLNRLDISIRHFSIALALMVLLLAPLPRMLETLRGPRPQLANAAKWLTMGLLAVSLISVVRAYPNYIPYLSSLSMGRPGYVLVNDSNLDWNQALPEVEKFVQQHGLKEILLDEYGFSEPGAYVPEAKQWSCQQPAANDGGQWAALSANFLMESGNCIWLMQYPHQTLGGGSMYVVQLPVNIPAAGEIGGPPLPAGFRYFAGVSKNFDPREIFAKCIRDPEQLRPAMDKFAEQMQEAKKKK